MDDVMENTATLGYWTTSCLTRRELNYSDILLEESWAIQSYKEMRKYCCFGIRDYVVFETNRKTNMFTHITTNFV